MVLIATPNSFWIFIFVLQEYVRLADSIGNRIQFLPEQIHLRILTNTFDIVATYSEHTSSTTGWIIECNDLARLGELFFFARENKRGHEADNIARRVVLSSSFI